MPKHPFSAPGEAMPRAKLDRAIMKAAWASYRRWFEGRNRPLRFKASDFAVYLAAAWRNAKAAQMSATETSAERIRQEIEGLKFKTLRINVDPIRTRLETQLAALSA